MLLTVIYGEQILPLEVGPEMELENFAALVFLEIPELESIPKQRLSFMLNQRQIILTADNLTRSLQVCYLHIEFIGSLFRPTV